MPEAFDRLRSYARGHNRRLHDVATDLIDETLDISDNHRYTNSESNSRPAR